MVKVLFFGGAGAGSGFMLMTVGFMWVRCDVLGLCFLLTFRVFFVLLTMLHDMFLHEHMNFCSRTNVSENALLVYTLQFRQFVGVMWLLVLLLVLLASSLIPSFFVFRSVCCRTAIMGEPSPEHSVGDSGSVLRGPLFEEPLDTQQSTLEPEAQSPENASRGPPRTIEFNGAVSDPPSPSPSDGRGEGLDVDEGGVSSLGDRMSGLQLGADEGEEVASFGGDDVAAGGISSVPVTASPAVAVAVDGEEEDAEEGSLYAAIDGAPGDEFDRQDMAVDGEPTLPDAAASAAAASAATAHSVAREGSARSWLEPPSPAVASAPAGAVSKPTFSPKEDAASAEVSPYGAKAKRGGGMSTSSTFGLSSDDDDGDAPNSFPAHGGAMGAEVAEMKLPTLPRVEENLVGEPQAVAPGVEDGGLDGGRGGFNAAGVGGGDKEKKEGQQEKEVGHQQQQEEEVNEHQGEEEGGGGAVSDPAASDGSPADTVASCMRDVAGGTNAAIDCESSVILDEMLLDAGAGAGLGLGARSSLMAKGNGEGKRKAGDMDGASATVPGRQKTAAPGRAGVVMSAVEKEAMTLAAVCVAEMEGKVGAGSTRPSVGGAGDNAMASAKKAGEEAGEVGREGTASSLPLANFGVTAPGKDGTVTRRRQSGVSGRRRSSVLPGAPSPGARSAAAKSATAARSAKAAASATAAKQAAAARVAARVAAVKEAKAATAKSAEAKLAEAKANKAAAVEAAREKALALAAGAKAAAAAKEEAAAKTEDAVKAAAAKKEAEAKAKTEAVAQATAAAAPAVAVESLATEGDGEADAPAAPVAASPKVAAASPNRRSRTLRDSPAAAVPSISVSSSVGPVGGVSAAGSAAGSASRSDSPRVPISRVFSPARGRRGSGVNGRRDTGRMSFSTSAEATASKPSSTLAAVAAVGVGAGAGAEATAKVARPSAARRQSVAMGVRAPDAAPARGLPVRAVASVVASSSAEMGATAGVRRAELGATGGDVKKATSRGRDRSARGTGINGRGVGLEFGRRKDSGVGAGGIAAAAGEWTCLGLMTSVDCVCNCGVGFCRCFLSPSWRHGACGRFFDFLDPLHVFGLYVIGSPPYHLPASIPPDSTESLCSAPTPVPPLRVLLFSPSPSLPPVPLAFSNSFVCSVAVASEAPAQAAAPAVAAVAPSSRLLAPTAVSQGRARPRSASPAVAAARGRASVGGFGSGPANAGNSGGRASDFDGSICGVPVGVG